MLKSIADRLIMVAQKGDIVSRLGGDEFVILTENTDDHAVCELADAILHTVKQPIPLITSQYICSASIGIVLDNGERNAKDILRDSDSAMYRAKEEGKNRWPLHDESMHFSIKRKLELAIGLHDAL